ncbi:hypothetical protein OQA88_8194 [Cercophora sp. LCS_1]
MAEFRHTPLRRTAPAPGLPSPTPSNTSTWPLTTLPHPRGHALRPGSAKEDKVRQFVSTRIAHISRRFLKYQSGEAQLGGDAVGYKSMTELCKDLDELINIIWLSGTPSLQVPYFLNIASELNTWLKAFPPSPKPTFSILTKLDHCFASLLSGQDVDTKEVLPGFENGLKAGMSRTDMVRCRSTVQQTRVIIMDVMVEELDEDEDVEEPSQQPTDSEADDGPTDWGRIALRVNDQEDEERHMDMARVYERTLVQLGETLKDGGGVGDIQISDD